MKSGKLLDDGIVNYDVGLHLGQGQSLTIPVLFYQLH